MTTSLHQERCLQAALNTDLGLDSSTTEADPVFSESDSNVSVTGGEYSESEAEVEDLRWRITYYRGQGQAKLR